MQIDKGIPIGENSAGRPSKYPWHEMDDGDSVFIEGETTAGSAVVSARRFGKIYGKRFAARAVEGGVRIWRTE